MERLADLDELVLRCRTDLGANYISEAVSCYRAGAYRSCIVSTWVAIVYDLLDKVRELALHGEAKAVAFVKTFTDIQEAQARSDPDALRRSLEFERSILDRVRDDFEMLTATEHLDIMRVREDRNRCAHPTMNQPNEAYKPTAEQARLHLRNAVTHVLQQPPAQGKSALEAVKRDLGSAYLPIDEDKIFGILKSGPLARARDNLLKETTGWLVAEFFNYKTGGPTSGAILSSINALRRLRNSVVEPEVGRVMRAETNKIGDQKLYAPIIFVRHIPGTWDMLTEAQKSRISIYIERAEDHKLAPIIEHASKIDALSGVVKQRIEKLNAAQITAYARFGGEQLAKRALELLSASRSFASSNTLIANVIIPMLPGLTEELVEDFIRVASSNSEARFAFEFNTAINTLRSNKIIEENKLDQLLEKYKVEFD